MTLSEDTHSHHSGTRAWIGRRLRDAIVLTLGAVLALPLIVPFA
jgi:hypothetical protein